MVNGLKAIILFDFGSTSNLISLEFVKGTGCHTFEFENPTQLQLGCSSKKLTISHRAQVPIWVGNTLVDVYLDIVNLDLFDVGFSC
ncbi:hypothetical protein K466DRAFT_504701 [Polyporus arcularius HHB13444]|uniref:Uncharacterized protein n=1 Tax=Polyporus arcularius HHB13444 TaxID=1314778 RepID=A0A5C3P2I8_9APHY|nr:hypothetical protein K466DRAFT_504701 [Polyporus arcularius HHB13444]